MEMPRPEKVLVIVGGSEDRTKGEILYTCDSGFIRDIKKSTRKLRVCDKCDKEIPAGVVHVERQNYVVFRQAYWRTERNFCLTCYVKPKPDTTGQELLGW